jgi:hypothetical protein
MKSIFAQYGVLASVSSATFEWVFYGTSSSSDTYSYQWGSEGATDDLAEMIDIITDLIDPKDAVGDFAIFYSTVDSTYYFFEAVQTS